MEGVRAGWNAFLARGAKGVRVLALNPAPGRN